MMLKCLVMVRLLITVGLTVSCHSAMSVEDAKKVGASFSEDRPVVVPRATEDVLAILKQEKLDDPGAIDAARKLADEPPPASTDAAVLGEFYFRRGMAAARIGRLKQQTRDLTEAERHLAVAKPGSAGYFTAVFRLAVAEAWDAQRASATKRLEKALPYVPYNMSWAITMNYQLVFWYAFDGHQELAERALARAKALARDPQLWVNKTANTVAELRAQIALASGRVFELKGQFADAEKSYREAVTILSADDTAAKGRTIDVAVGSLALVLAQQGKLVEAEIEARKGLIATLRKWGGLDLQSSEMAQHLAQALFEQGKYTEAETLAREVQAKKEALGTRFNQGGRRVLIRALVAQERWGDALVEYDRIARGRWPLPDAERRFLTNPDTAMALIMVQRSSEAVRLLEAAVAENRQNLGESHPVTATYRGLLGAAYTKTGDPEAARREFAASTPILLQKDTDIDDDGAGTTARDRRRAFILTAYIGLLTDPSQGQMFVGFDPVGEAFRLAEVVRSQAVNRALQASALRGSAKNAELADLVRREQDAGRYVAALYGRLADQLSAPPADRDDKLVGNLRVQIDSLQKARRTISTQIARDFPAYAELTTPSPATIAQLRTMLRPREALISTLVAWDRTFVWAIPQQGPVLVTAAPIGRSDLMEAVVSVRGAVDSGAETLGDILEFDVATAHDIYRLLLEPVQPAWESAHTLFVVPHGPLGQLPFSLLPTKAVTLGAEQDVLFSRYRVVPWLGRTHAIAVLPAAGSLVTLRRLPPGDPLRFPFIGFGDPLFSEEQARRAAAMSTSTEDSETLGSRGVPIALRRSPARGVDSSQLALLPRLPETAEEIRSIALAMNADVTKAVFLGAQANEKTVRSVDLSKYRVIAFATHGLVAGDLEGLTQPALALTAPDVAKIDGDGLLTVDEILELRLNADWVVLSACNTGSGQGTGSEAVSGLGRAFFYAGARSLLVSNWPVETTSAKVLTTDLFKRQAANPGQGRAQALQDTINALIEGGVYVDPLSKKTVFSYAHPIFWAPFILVGDGGESTVTR